MTEDQQRRTDEQQRRTVEDEREQFHREVERKKERSRRAREEGDRTIQHGLGVFGVVGWSIVVPTLIGIAIGSVVRFPLWRRHPLHAFVHGGRSSRRYRQRLELAAQPVTFSRNRVCGRCFSKV